MLLYLILNSPVINMEDGAGIEMYQVGTISRHIFWENYEDIFFYYISWPL